MQSFKNKIMELIKYVKDTLIPKKSYPAFRSGDSVSISYKIVEGAKERIQIFKGDVISISGDGATKSFTVRKISNGVGVERIFPYGSPAIVDIEITKKGKVRRAKLYYLRALKGKASRIKEKRQR